MMRDQVGQNPDAPEGTPELDPRGQHEAAVTAQTPVSTTGEDSSLEFELAQAKQECADLRDKYLRAMADMENYKKRIERTYRDLSRSTKKDLLRRLLTVKDNLERAIQYGDVSENGEGIVEGVRLTQYQLEQLLETEGVKSIDAEGKQFDPRLEEAVHSVNDPSVPDHTVVQVVRRGYTYEDDVLRPAQVVVSVHEGSSAD
jgi:molecular chaperone GrpE